MKKLQFQRLPILSMFFLLSFSGCNEEEVLNTGTLSLSVVNHENVVDVAVYSLDNLSLPIDRIKLDRNGSARKTLNMGNYLISVVSDNHYGDIACQVRPNGTTSIKWGDDNNPFLQ